VFRLRPRAQPYIRGARLVPASLEFWRR